jgi:hypothetical protein
MNKLLFSLFLMLSSFAFAGNSLSTKIHNQYVSLRALGMGNAYTAVADDYTLIFYNPAGFAKKKNNEIQFTLIGASVAPSTLKFAKDIQEASDSGGSSETAQAIAISGVLDEYAGDTMGGRFQAAEMFWIRKNWGFALVPLDLSLDVTVDKGLGPSIDLNMIKDTTLALGMGKEASKELSWGVTLKGIHRLQVSERLIAIQLATEPDLVSADRAKEGFVVDADIGLLYSPSWFSKTTTKRVPQAEASGTTKKSKAKTTKLRTKEEGADLAEGAAATVGADGLSLTVEGASETEEKKEESKLVEIQEETYPLTFSFVARNVTGGNFALQKLVNKDATQAPEKLQTVFDLGSQYEFATFGSLTLRAMLDFKNLNHPEISPIKSTHAGVEFDWSPSGWFKTQFRAGMNQGYYTAGTTLLLGFFNIEAATYGEEVGTSETKIENRVYAAKLGMNF